MSPPRPRDRGADHAPEDAFTRLRLPDLISIIDPENTRSRRVAVRIGMTIGGQLPIPHAGDGSMSGSCQPVDRSVSAVNEFTPAQLKADPSLRASDGQIREITSLSLTGPPLLSGTRVAYTTGSPASVS